MQVLTLNGYEMSNEWMAKKYFVIPGPVHKDPNHHDPGPERPGFEKMFFTHTIKKQTLVILTDRKYWGLMEDTGKG